MRLSSHLVAFSFAAGSLALVLGLVGGDPGFAGADASTEQSQFFEDRTLTQKTIVQGRFTSIGNLGLGLTNLGFFGNQLQPAVTWPSCEYPLNSKVEHLYLAGPWIGGVSSEGDTLVSAGAEDTSSNAQSPKQEYGPRPEDNMTLISSNPLSGNFSLSAVADQEYLFQCDDRSSQGGGTASDEDHRPLGLRLSCRVLAYSQQFADDFVIMDYRVINDSSREITDVYLGWYNELTVGNTTVTIPGSDTNGWFFWDDINGYLQPGDVEDDPDIRMMYVYDDDGEDGKAPSWLGLRLLGTDPPASIHSYRQWRFGNVPRTDREKYEFMSTARVDVGLGEDQNGQDIDFSAASNWISMMGWGPVELFSPGDTLSFTLAYVAGLDSLQMLRNSQVAQATFDQGFKLPAGPPSPRLEITTDNHQVVLEWEPGIPSDDPTLASPEFHRSDLTGELDFQGYRIYRLQAESISSDPIEQASLLAQFDIVDGKGFDTGLPPLTADGKRRFVDDGVLNGFDYWYSVTSYSARNALLNLDELESGFNENSIRLIPGTTPPSSEPDAAKPAVGVYPNPYRGAGMFDGRLPGGEPRELGRTVYFTNVPARATIEVFNLSGSLIDRIRHDDTSTGQVEWDMLSENTRAIAPGLYIYAVTDDVTGDVQRGKLVILK